MFTGAGLPPDPCPLLEPPFVVPPGPGFVVPPGPGLDPAVVEPVESVVELFVEGTLGGFIIGVRPPPPDTWPVVGPATDPCPLVGPATDPFPFVEPATPLIGC